MSTQNVDVATLLLTNTQSDSMIQSMRQGFHNVNTFLGVVNECTGDVILTSEYGDKYNLKSTLSQYIAIAALLGQHGEKLELWCSNREDEAKFLHMFLDNPEMM